MKRLKAALVVVVLLLTSFALTGCQYLQPPQPPQPSQPAPAPVQPLPPGLGQPGMPGPGQPGMPGPIQPGMPIQPGVPGQPGMPEPGQQGMPMPPQPGAPQPGQPGLPGPDQPPSAVPGGQPTSTGNVPAGCAGAPMIASFTADKTTINMGESVTLVWGAVTNGTTGPLVGSVTIEPGVGEVGSPGARPVTPSQTTTYTLTGKGCGGTATKQLTITVNASSGPSTGPSTGSGPSTSSCAGAPAISSFSADPATVSPGQKGKLKWGYVTNVTKVEIDHGIGPVPAPGEHEVAPSGLGATTYTLTATGCDGTKITKQASVSVMLTATILSFDLGISDVYPASTGKIWARIKNSGTGAVNNTNITLTCSAQVTKTSGNSQSTATTPPVSKSIPINLDQGQTADFETGFARDPSIQSMWVTCSITSVATDSNKTNDTLGKQVK